MTAQRTETIACQFCGIELHVHATTPSTTWATAAGSLSCQTSTFRTFAHIDGGTVGRHLPVGI